MLLPDSVEVRETAENQRVAGEGWRSVEARWELVFREDFKLRPRLEHKDSSLLAGEVDPSVGKYG